MSTAPLTKLSNQSITPSDSTKAVRSPTSPNSGKRKAINRNDEDTKRTKRKIHHEFITKPSTDSGSSIDTPEPIRLVTDEDREFLVSRPLWGGELPPPPSVAEDQEFDKLSKEELIAKVKELMTANKKLKETMTHLYQTLTTKQQTKTRTTNKDHLSNKV